MRKEDERNPTERAICEWIAFESLFIEPKSMAKYVQAVRYYLDSYNKREVTRGVLIKRMLRALCKKYGKPVKDDRENVTLDLLLKITKKIDLSDHVEVCCMAASVIAFLNCLRCGEFTINNPCDRFLKKGDWKQDPIRGQIYLKYSKTDVFGRGHYIKYRQMDFDLDPIFWMNRYAKFAQALEWTEEKPLFMLPNGRPLNRKTLVEWLRKMAKRVGHPNAEKLSGISFRRGGAQALRDQGYGLDKLGRLGRWTTPESAARYVTLTDAVVDEFAGAFLKATQKHR